jgi:hypothetical protein
MQTVPKIRRKNWINNNTMDNFKIFKIKAYNQNIYRKPPVFDPSLKQRIKAVKTF